MKWSLKSLAAQKILIFYEIKVFCVISARFGLSTDSSWGLNFSLLFCKDRNVSKNLHLERLWKLQGNSDSPNLCSNLCSNLFSFSAQLNLELPRAGHSSASLANLPQCVQSPQILVFCIWICCISLWEEEREGVTSSASLVLQIFIKCKNFLGSGALIPLDKNVQPPFGCLVTFFSTQFLPYPLDFGD